MLALNRMQTRLAITRKLGLDECYISQDEFNDVYRQAARTRAAIRGFINYLTNYEKGNGNSEP